MTSSRRFAILAERDINKETYVEPWAEAGLIVTDSPYDPQPSLRIAGGPGENDETLPARDDPLGDEAESLVSHERREVSVAPDAVTLHAGTL